MVYKIAYHRGGLKECLATEKEISRDEYLKIKSQYEFYSYDDRINAYRFILKDIEHNYNKPTWIHIYK